MENSYEIFTFNTKHMRHKDNHKKEKSEITDHMINESKIQKFKDSISQMLRRKVVHNLTNWNRANKYVD